MIVEAAQATMVGTRLDDAGVADVVPLPAWPTTCAVATNKTPARCSPRGGARAAPASLLVHVEHVEAARWRKR